MTIRIPHTSQASKGLLHFSFWISKSHGTGSSTKLTFLMLVSMRSRQCHVCARTHTHSQRQTVPAEDANEQIHHRDTHDYCHNEKPDVDGLVHRFVLFRQCPVIASLNFCHAKVAQSTEPEGVKRNVSITSKCNNAAVRQCSSATVQQRDSAAGLKVRRNRE